MSPHRLRGRDSRPVHPVVASVLAAMPGGRDEWVTVDELAEAAYRRGVEVSHVDGEWVVGGKRLRSILRAARTHSWAIRDMPTLRDGGPERWHRTPTGTRALEAARERV